MKDIELIENYLTDKLTVEQRLSFENQLQTDQSLKSDVAFQRSILESIKKARAAELKSMLQKIPIQSSPYSLKHWSALKVAVGVIGGSILLTGLYYQFIVSKKNPETASIPPSENLHEDEKTNLTSSSNKVVVDAYSSTQPLRKSQSSGVSKNHQKSAVTSTHKKTVTDQNPNIQIAPPTMEMDNEHVVYELANPSDSHSVNTTTSSLQVEIISNAKYSFHYELSNGRLILYGSFDKGLYEIIEFSGHSHSIFLYYQNQYYLLDEKQNNTINKLSVVTNKSLLEKLKEYKEKRKVNN